MVDADRVPVLAVLRVAAIGRLHLLMDGKTARLRGLSFSAVGFILFCLLSSAGWLIPPIADPVPTLERLGVVYGLLGLFFGVRGFGERRWVWLALTAMGLIGVPAVFLEVALGTISGASASAGFAFVPIVVIMVVAFSGDGGARRLLVPALVALGGVLLLLPVEFPSALRGRLMFGGLVLVVVLVAVLSVWMYRLLQGFALAEAIAVVCLSNSMFLLVSCLIRGEFVWRWSALASIASMSSLVGAIVVVLMVWLLRKMTPVRFAARYLVIPFFTVLEGYVLLRPDLTVRMGFGLCLLAVGAGVILISRGGEDEGVLSLR